MPTYTTHEARFSLPAGWMDDSMNVLEYKKGDITIRLTVSRMPRAGKSLDTHVSEHTDDQRRRLHMYEAESKREISVANKAGLDVIASYADGESRAYYRNVYVLFGDTCVVITTLGPLDAKEDCDAILEHAIATIRLRDVVEDVPRA